MFFLGHSATKIQPYAREGDAANEEGVVGRAVKPSPSELTEYTEREILIIIGFIKERRVEKISVRCVAVKLKEGTSTLRILLKSKPLESKMAAKAAEAVPLTMRRTGEKWTLSPRRRDILSVSSGFWVLPGPHTLSSDIFIRRIKKTERRR